MAAVTSKSTVCPCATAPRVASAGPSIAGCVFQVTVRSSQLHPVIAWRVPPATLCALVTLATCNWRCAEETRRGPTPLTLTRRKTRCTPAPPGAVDGAGPAEFDALPLRHRAGRREHRPIDGGLRLPGHGALVPPAVRDRMDAAARHALGIGHLCDLQPHASARHLAGADAAHAHAEEGALHGGAGVGGGEGARPEVGARAARRYVGVRLDHGHRHSRGADERRAAHARSPRAGVVGGAGTAVVTRHGRSEERRVGREWWRSGAA